MESIFVNSAQNMGRRCLDMVVGLNIDVDGSMACEELLNFLGPEATRLETINDLIVGKVYIRDYYQRISNIGKRQANRELQEQDFIMQRRGIHFTSTTSLEAYRNECIQDAALGRRQAGIETDNLIRMTVVSSGSL